MSFLLTADWQASWSNLDLCSRALEEVLVTARNLNLRAIVFIGDLKHDFNPVDVRVTNFWMEAIRRVRRSGMEFIVVKGNHDLISPHSEHDWFPPFSRAGARVFTELGFWDYREFCTRKGLGDAYKKDKYRLYALPYRHDPAELRRWAGIIYNDSRGYDGKRFLLFHCDVKGARYNTLGKVSPGTLTPQDLKYTGFDRCVGGHIHKPQQVAHNIYYVGSPFATDWGEANQRKGYWVYSNGNWSFVFSKLPGMYDPTWPEFTPPVSWAGARVRIHVKCPVGKNYGQAIEDAKLRAEKKYNGAAITLIPEFEESSEEGFLPKASDSDRTNLEKYLDRYLPKDLRSFRGKIISHLMYKLGKVSPPLRASSGVKFVRVEASRFLSFRGQIALDVKKRGLVLVRGRNNDWPGHSNGAGKTGLLQLLPVALFGETFKGQKHDSWAYRKSKKRAWVRLTFTDVRGRVVEIYRSRRPGRLVLKIDGVDQSSGRGGRKANTTQELIERITGFTFRTFANSVCIDRTVVEAFLTGTSRVRKQVLEKFQNLERFSQALDLMKADERRREQARELALDWLRSRRSLAAAFKVGLDSLESSSTDALREEQQNLAGLRRKQKALLAANQELGVNCKKKLATLRQSLEALRKEETVYNNLTEECFALELEQKKLEKALAHTRCPVCTQIVDKEILKSKLAANKRSLATLTARREKLGNPAEDLEEVQQKIVSVQHRLEVADRAAEEISEWVREAESRVHKVAKTAAAEASRRAVLEKKYRRAKRQAKLAADHLRILTNEEPFYQFCMRVFSRDGLPAFLNRLLCPRLNKAAEYYSDLFCSKQIQVRFSVSPEGEFDVNVLNPTGGPYVEDQSTGELQMVGLITSFALRDAAPQCNLLVLDEPGDGLDDANARAFAEGIKKLRSKFETILVTSHNAHILSALGGEKIVTVEKSQGNSTLQWEDTCS